MSKQKEPIQLLTELGIPHDDGYGELFGRQFRYLKHCGVLQISDEDFDRWSNSVELIFEIWKPSGQREFIRWFNQTKEGGMKSGFLKQLFCKHRWNRNTYQPLKNAHNKISVHCALCGKSTKIDRKRYVKN